MELACLHLNGQEKNNTEWTQKAALCDSQKIMVCYFNPLLFSILLFQFNMLFPHIISVYDKKSEIIHVWGI